MSWENDVEKWTAEEKEKALLSLLAMREVAAPVNFDGALPGAAFLPLHFDKIESGCSVTAQVHSHEAFIAKQLVVLEPTVDIVEQEIVETYRDIPSTPSLQKQRWWQRKPKVEMTEPSLVHVIDKRQVVNHKRLEVVSRGVWSIHGCFIGSKSQFPTFEGAISGSAFGPVASDNPKLAFREPILQSGAFFTLQIRNNGKSAYPFYAVVLGQRAEIDIKRPRKSA